MSDIESLCLLDIRSDSVDELVSAYKKELRKLLDKHAPKRSINVIVRPNIPWYNTKIEASKRLKRKLESLWRKSKLPCDKLELRKHCNAHIKFPKNAYFPQKIDSCGTDHKRLYRILNTLLGKASVQMPCFASGQTLADNFNDFLITKIRKIKDNLDSATNYYIPEPEPVFDSSFCEFEPFTEDEIKVIIMKLSNSSCDLNPIPTKLLKLCLDQLLGPITCIVNMSLESGVFPKDLKHVLVRPTLKKPTLDSDFLKQTIDQYRTSPLFRILSKRQRLHGRRSIYHTTV